MDANEVTVNGFAANENANLGLTDYPYGIAPLKTPTSILGPDGRPLRDGFALPHVITFSGVVGTIRTYRTTWDEALRHSRTNALAMRRDAFITQCLRERQLPTAQMAWHLETDDPKNPEQQLGADRLTRIIKNIPHLQKLLLTLLEAVWEGRYGSQFVFGEQMINGVKATNIVKHLPVNADKIQYTWDGVPAILIHTRWAMSLEDAEIVRTDRGVALLLQNPYWRNRFAIHTHELHDADYLEPELAGGIHGVGIRQHVYWVWWLWKECESWLLDYLERVGAGGLTVFLYESGNPTAEKAARTAAEQQSRSNVILWPYPAGTEKPSNFVERIEPSQVGSQILMDLMQKYFQETIKKLIVGQTLSSGTGSTGLGSKVAEFHADTKSHIIQYDAENVAQTLTSDVVTPLKIMNMPEIDYNMRWVFGMDKPNVEKIIEAASKIYEMGISLDGDEVRQFAGLSKPEDNANVVQKQPDQPAMPLGGGPTGEEGEEEPEETQGFPAQETKPNQESEPKKFAKAPGTGNFEENKHPRGQPDNKGKFGQGSGGSTGKPMPQPKQEQIHPASATPPPIEEAIYDAVQSAGQMHVADLRQQFPDVPTQAMDEVLIKMYKRHLLTFAAHEGGINAKTGQPRVTPEQIKGALDFHGEKLGLVMIKKQQEDIREGGGQVGNEVDTKPPEEHFQEKPGANIQTPPANLVSGTETRSNETPRFTDEPEKYAKEHPWHVTPEYLATIKKEIDNLGHEWEEGDERVYIGDVDGNRCYLVNGDQVKLDKHEMDFVEAGNYQRYHFIPANQIWLDGDLESHEIKPNCLHEAIEVRLMENGMQYDPAHDIANHYEEEYRRELGEDGQSKQSS